MDGALLVAGVLFHLAVLVISWQVCRAWARGAGVLGGVALFGVTMVAAALPVSLVAPDPFFAWVRLVSQALFGEGVLLLAVGAALQVGLGRRRRGAALVVAAIALLAVYWEAYHHGPRDLRVRNVELSLGHGHVGRELRVLHLSDIQTDAVGEHERRAVREGLSTRPDLIVLTGDYLQRGLAPLAPSATTQMRELLARLRAPHGVYAVPGDTDRGCALFRGLHIRCLEDETERIRVAGGRSIALTGLTARSSRTGRPEDLAPILAGAPASDYHLVMGHSPDFVRALARWGRVDLALAGHTHGGQVTLPLVGPLVTLSRLPRRYAGGLHDYEGIPLHVSRGVGLERGSAPPIRFLCPPEVTLLRIRYPARAESASPG